MRGGKNPDIYEVRKILELHPFNEYRKLRYRLICMADLMEASRIMIQVKALLLSLLHGTIFK